MLTEECNCDEQIDIDDSDQKRSSVIINKGIRFL